VDTPHARSGHPGSACKVAVVDGDACVIVPPMKRSAPKLTMRRETIRALVIAELTYANGGSDALPAESGKIQCPMIVAPSGLAAKSPGG